MNLIKHIIRTTLFLMVMIGMVSCGMKLRKHVPPADTMKNPQDRQKTEVKIIKSDKPMTGELPAEYELGYGDMIDIKFFNNSEFNENLIIRPDGRISMEVIGEIYVQGMTPAQLGDVIEQSYSRLVKDPQATVIVRQFGGQRVYVLGEVENPGAYPIQREYSILQILAEAGGFKNSANLKSIVLIRRHSAEDISAQRIDLSLKSSAEIDMNDFTLQSYDIIYVPKHFIANVNTFLQQALAGFIQPLDLYLRASLLYKWQ